LVRRGEEDEERVVFHQKGRLICVESDAVTTNLQDPLMNALANSLMQVDLNRHFNDVDQLANTLSRTNIDDPQFPVLRRIHWRYVEGKTQGLYSQWRMENIYLHLGNDEDTARGMELSLTAVIER
tara:strand:- start:183 stop:557 length:375 start_codon:yes stop_codon:yes gene_type:complete